MTVSHVTWRWSIGCSQTQYPCYCYIQARPLRSDLSMSSLHIPLSVCCVYILPNPGSIYISSLVSYLSNLAAIPCSDIRVVGDFNLPDIDCMGYPFCGIPLFWAILWLCFNLTQLIDKPTHVKGNILDLIVTNTSHHIQEINSCNNHFMHSDHSIITFKVTHSVLLSHKLHRNMCLIFPKQTQWPLFIFNGSWLHSTYEAVHSSENDVLEIWPYEVDIIR